MTAIWWLYLAALVAELGGLTLGGLDLLGRASKIAAFSRPTPPMLPAEFNEHPAVAEGADGGPAGDGWAAGGANVAVGSHWAGGGGHYCRGGHLAPAWP